MNKAEKFFHTTRWQEETLLRTILNVSFRMWQNIQGPNRTVNKQQDKKGKSTHCMSVLSRFKCFGKNVHIYIFKNICLHWVISVKLGNPVWEVILLPTYTKGTRFTRLRATAVWWEAESWLNFQQSSTCSKKTYSSTNKIGLQLFFTSSLQEQEKNTAERAETFWSVPWTPQALCLSIKRMNRPASHWFL